MAFAAAWSGAKRQSGECGGEGIRCSGKPSPLIPRSKCPFISVERAGDFFFAVSSYGGLATTCSCLQRVGIARVDVLKSRTRRSLYSLTLQMSDSSDMDDEGSTFSPEILPQSVPVRQSILLLIDS